MYTRLLILFSALSVCAGNISKPILLDIRGNQITLNREDGRGVRIVTDQISQQMNQPFIQIYISGPGVTPKIVQLIDHQRMLTGQSQSNTVRQIFAQFKGTLDDAEYAQLILAIAEQIVNGQVSPAVLYALEVFTDEYQGVQIECPYLNKIYKSQITRMLADQGDLTSQFPEVPSRRLESMISRSVMPWQMRWDEMEKAQWGSSGVPRRQSEMDASQQWWLNQNQLSRKWQPTDDWTMGGRRLASSLY